MRRQRKKASIFSHSRKSSSKRNEHKNSKVNTETLDHTKKIPISEIKSKGATQKKVMKKGKKKHPFLKKIRNFVLCRANFALTNADFLVIIRCCVKSHGYPCLFR